MTVTLEREKYFDKCSAKELKIRKEINWCKQHIKMAKEILNLSEDDMVKFASLNTIRSFKSRLTIYKHELARIKNIERVAVPRRTQKVIFRIHEDFQLSKTGLCKCGERLTEILHIHCPKCGRRILWEKVEQC